MVSGLRSRATYANVMATIAVFLALGGSAYAVATVTGADVVDESLTGLDVRGTQGTPTTPAVNGSIGTQDIGGQPANGQNGSPFIDGSLTTSDIRNNSLSGDDIANDVAGSDKVNATRLDGIDSSRYMRGTGNIYHAHGVAPGQDIEQPPSPVTVLTVPGFGVVQHECHEGGRGILFDNVSGGDLNAWWRNNGGAGFKRLANKGSGDSVASLTSHIGTNLVLLEVSRGDRNATITASQDISSSNCIYSIQAVALVD